MAGSVAAIEAAYANISTGERPGADFARFESEVDKWAFDEWELIMHAASSNTPAQLAIDRIRDMQAVIPGTPSGNYFRGSGIIVVGDERKILVGHYKGHDSDPVADKYGPNYRTMGLVKIGRAALAGRLVGPDAPFVDGYAAVEAELRELKGPGDPHTIGYAWRKTATSLLTAGASGMLASKPVQTVAEALYGDIVLSDHHNGLVEWEGDYFAGYHDQVAAEGTLAELKGQPAASAMPSIAVLDNHGVNLH